jgi:Arc/MetJ-type ribon-helix-helix transcriptional regulator
MTSDEKFSSDEFSAEQWERIRAHIRARGMNFEVFLPQSQANWLRAQLAAGVFKDAGEAAFVAFQTLQELDCRPKVRQALLRAMIRDGTDSGPGISFEEMCEQHRAELREYSATEPPSK